MYNIHAVLRRFSAYSSIHASGGAKPNETGGIRNRFRPAILYFCNVHRACGFRVLRTVPWNRVQRRDHKKQSSSGSYTQRHIFSQSHNMYDRWPCHVPNFYYFISGGGVPTSGRLSPRDKADPVADVGQLYGGGGLFVNIYSHSHEQSKQSCHSRGVCTVCLYINVWRTAY